MLNLHNYILMYLNITFIQFKYVPFIISPQVKKQYNIIVVELLTHVKSFTQFLKTTTHNFFFLDQEHYLFYQ